MTWDLTALSVIAGLSFAIWLGLALAPWIRRWIWWQRVRPLSYRNSYIRANVRREL